MDPKRALPRRAHFGDRLRDLRRSRGFRTAKSFALALGIGENTYTRYERGEVEPNITLLERMWSVLGLPDNELLGAGALLRGGLPASPRSSFELPGGSPPAGVSTAGASTAFAQGFAEPRGAAYGQARAVKPGPHEASAWQLAERIAEAVHGAPPDAVKPTGGNTGTPTVTSAAGDPLAVVREASRLYGALLAEPFTTLQRISTHPAVECLPAGERQTLGHDLKAFALASARRLTLEGR